MKMLNQVILLSKLAAGLGWRFDGDDVAIDCVGTLSEARSNAVTFSMKPQSSVVAGVLVSTELAAGQSGFVSANPRLGYTRILRYLTDNSYLDNLGKQHYIHPSVRIEANAIVEHGVVIGANTVVGPNVIIRSNVTIGANCHIGPNSVIGNRGFGYERDEAGVPIHMPHVGGVIIGDNVDIGALTTVISGTLGPTIIGNNSKLDDHVHFGHNCSVGESSIITACSEFSGGVKLGNRVWIGPNVSIKEKLTVSDDSYVGIASVVLKSVEAKQVVVGNPARHLRYLD